MKITKHWSRMLYNSIVSLIWPFNWKSDLLLKYINYSVQDTKTGNYNGLNSMKCDSKTCVVPGHICYLLMVASLCCTIFAYWSGWEFYWGEEVNELRVEYCFWFNKWVLKVLESLLWTRLTKKFRVALCLVCRVTTPKQLRNSAKVVSQLEQRLFSLNMQMCWSRVIWAQLYCKGEEFFGGGSLYCKKKKKYWRDMQAYRSDRGSGNPHVMVCKYFSSGLPQWKNFCPDNLCR